jgi:hypothetical protein
MRERMQMNRWNVRTAVSIIFAIAANPSPAQGQPLTEAGDAVVLMTTYGDGRTVHDVVTRTARTAWTPVFPKLPGSDSVAGEPPVTAIKYRRALSDDGKVTVAVSVLRGQAHEKEQQIATVIVERGAPVMVDALRGVGVAPVTLRLTALSPTTLYPATALNRTAGLDIVSIEVLQEPNPRYEVTVRNVSSQPALNFHVVAYRGDRRALFGNQGHRDGSPIVAPNGLYSFTLDPAREMRSNSGEWAPGSHDSIEIAAVLWEDGTIEGDPQPMAAVLGLYMGRAAQLARAIAVLKAVRVFENPQRAKLALQGHIEQLSIEPDTAVLAAARERLRHLENIDERQVIGAVRTGMVTTRSGVLDDLREAPDDGVGFQRRLADLIALYEKWQIRFDGR